MFFLSIPPMLRIDPLRAEGGVLLVLAFASEWEKAKGRHAP